MKKLITLSLLSLLLIGCSSIKTANVQKSADVTHFSLLSSDYSSKDLRASSSYNTAMFEMKMNNYTLSLCHAFTGSVYDMNYDTINNILYSIRDPEIVEIKVYDEKNVIIAENVYRSVESDLKFVRSAKIMHSSYETIGKVEVVFSPKIKDKKELVDAKAEFYEAVFRNNLTLAIYDFDDPAFKSSTYRIMQDFSVVSVRFINNQGKERDYLYSRNEGFKYQQTIEKRTDLEYDYNLLGTVIIVYGIK